MAKKSIYILFLLILFSCHKREFKTYVGDYECSLFTAEVTPGKPVVYTITDGYEVTVVKDGKFVSILGEKIHINELEPDLTYTSSTGIVGDSIYFSVVFRNDSVYHETIRKVGEKSTTTTYFGVKI